MSETTETTKFPLLSEDSYEIEAAVWLEVEKAKHLTTEMAKAAVKGPNEVMSAWIGWMKKMATDLEYTRVKVEEEDMVLELTMGLGGHYDQLVVMLDSISPEQLTVRSVTIRLLNKKTHQKDAEDDRDVVAMMAKAGKGKWKAAAGGEKHKCFKCGEIEHVQKDCPTKSDDGKDDEEDVKAKVAYTDSHIHLF
ncbi:uncharacterized protein LAESUDRAFT_760567 [Laetiporus sulphureus 93-53]|uniref:CCHC-type domain-containing protein n=1 Tax=Laetiporus sulphureus 93-53 TaxID=1314785 RepID=A0A165DL34_9APHY|nr:uncharacterized protein LAESUDRAFT_760567 [Laetiporus sulphureus 93-53]KZT05119.1 hypothetical protein LAESUDRAFT_760567 [Laetiporus sulphureus 93-53]